MKSIRVNILGRDYALRVRDETEEQTRELARFVEDRMRRFKEAHPEQAELTTAVITALTLAEELHDVREQREENQQALNAELRSLADHLASALPDRGESDAEPVAPAAAKHDDA
jgi:cell division protein ZapA